MPITEYITYNNGIPCYFEVDYLVRFCLINGKPYYQIEINGWRILNNSSSACDYLYNQIMPNGVLNEMQARIFQIEIHKILADKFFRSFTSQLPISTRDNYFACNNIDEPLNAPATVQIFEVTCMAYCVTKGYDDFTPDHGSGPGGAGIANPFGLITLGRYYWTNVVNKKCSNACCNIFISYCWDNSLQTWKRKYHQKPDPIHTECPEVITEQEICVPPPYLFPRVTQITSIDFTPCLFMCSDYSVVQTINFP